MYRKGTEKKLIMKTLDFDALSANAREIVLVAENDYNIYQRLDWLASCVAKKVRKGVACTVEHLANCSTMKTIVRETAKEIQQFGTNCTMNERREACTYLAMQIFETLED